MPDVAQEQQDPTPSQDAAAPAAKATPKGQRIPQATFSEIRDLAVAMEQLNGPASRQRVFGTAGKSATGGVADTRWAALGYYGFRTPVSDGKFEITERGRASIGQDQAAAGVAKQDAVMASGFRVVVERFTTRAVNETLIAGALEDDLGVPEARAKKLAKLLVEVATEAGLIADGVFQVEPIERALEAVPTAADAKPVTVTRIAKPRVAAATSSNGSSATANPTPPAPTPATVLDPIVPERKAGPFGVTIDIRIEAEKHTPEQIGQIVREVREALSTAA